MKGGWETEERQMEDRAVHRESAAAAESRGAESEDEGEEGDERGERLCREGDGMRGDVSRSVEKEATQCFLF